MNRATYTAFPVPVPGPRPERLHLVDVWDAPEATFAPEPEHLEPGDLPAALRALADYVAIARRRPDLILPEGVPQFVERELRRLADGVWPEGGA